MGEIDEVKVNYEEALKKAKENEEKKQTQNYIPTNYETIKQVFQKSIKEYAQKEFILEKFEPKGKYQKITYEQFGKDVIGFRNRFNEKAKFKSRTKSFNFK